MSDVNINIRLITAAARAQARALQTSLQGIDTQTAKTQRGFKSLGSSIGGVGTIAKGVFLGGLLQSAISTVTNLVIDTAFAFTEFEKALIGVGKTTGIAGIELAELGEGIENLSREIPIATTELLGIAQVAGQLGVRGARNITKFTEVVAKLGATTDLEGESAALTLSRLLTITGESVGTVDKLGAVIVELGNNFAATESEIADVALDIGRGTAQFGLASKDILALATALKETGAQAEISGTQIGKVLREIDKAVTEGGPRLDKFSEIIGVSGDELGDFLKNDPSDVLFRFVGGLKSLQEQGVSTSQSLASLGLNTDRIQKVIPSLVKNYDGLTRAVSSANDQYERATALNDEAETQFASQASQIQILGNEFSELQKEISEAFAPITEVVIERLRSIIGFARDGAEALKELFNPQTEDLSALTAQQVTELENLNSSLVKVESNLSLVKDEFIAVEEAIIGGVNTTRRGTRANEESSKKLAIQIRLKREETNAIRQSIEAKRTEFGLVDQVDPVSNDPDDPKKKLKTDKKEELDIIRQFATIAREEREVQETLKTEQDAIRTEEDIRAFKQSLIAKELLDQEFKLNSLARENKQIELRKALIAIEVKAEAAAQKEKDKLRQLEITGKRQVNDDLSELGKAGAKEAFAIQKALAIQEAIVASGAAELSAIAFGTKLGGPALGAFFGVISKAATIARVANIASSQPPSFQNGGVVPGSSFSGDNVDARVNSGEVILNRQQQAQTLFAISNGQGQGQGQQGNQERVTNVTVEVDGEAIATAVSRQVADGLVLGENQ